MLVGGGGDSNLVEKEGWGELQEVTRGRGRRYSAPPVLASDWTTPARFTPAISPPPPPPPPTTTIPPAPLHPRRPPSLPLAPLPLLILLILLVLLVGILLFLHLSSRLLLLPRRCSSSSTSSASSSSATATSTSFSFTELYLLVGSLLLLLVRASSLCPSARVRTPASFSMHRKTGAEASVCRGDSRISTGSPGEPSPARIPGIYSQDLRRIAEHPSPVAFSKFWNEETPSPTDGARSIGIHSLSNLRYVLPVYCNASLNCRPNPLFVRPFLLLFLSQSFLPLLFTIVYFCCDR